MKTFEILFVRHALSCANVWQKKSYFKQHIFYRDPEITTEGMKRSIEIGNQIQYPFHTRKQEPFTIGASVMLRAHQTAYLMFAKRMKKPIYIIPHIGEIFPTMDNFPHSPEKQQERYNKNKIYTQEPSLQELVVNDGVNFQYPISSLSSFLEWLTKPENERYFGKGSDGIYRAVLVTHSGFLRYNFPMGNIKKYNNNDGILVQIKIEGNNHEIKPIEYLPAGETNINSNICPDVACTYPPPCKTRGGKRKSLGRRRFTRRFQK